MLVAINPMQGKYLTACAIYRGKVSSREAEQAINDITTKQSSSFVEYIPDNVSFSEFLRIILATDRQDTDVDSSPLFRPSSGPDQVRNVFGKYDRHRGSVPADAGAVLCDVQATGFLYVIKLGSRAPYLRVWS